MKAMYYVALFYSHFGAIRFINSLPESIVEKRMMPVPRSLSASCGTCVRFKGPDDYTFTVDESHEVEQIVKETKDGYITVFKAE